MSVKNFTLNDGATLVAPTGGTAASFTDDGTVVPNGVKSVAVGDEFLVRRATTFRVKPPSFDAASGAYNKTTRSMLMVWPLNRVVTGKQGVDTVRVELSVYPEHEDEVAAYLNQVIQVLQSASSADFWERGSLA